MSIIQAVILGIVQGITEFLPVSSSGHLIFVPHFFGWADQGLAFDVIVHLGTLCAVIYMFRARLKTILLACIRPLQDDTIADRKLGGLLLLSVIPAGIVGFWFGEFIETTLRNATVVGVSLIVWGIVLAWVDRAVKHRDQITKVTDIGWGRTALISCAQAIALIPGTSRSGITMISGRAGNLSREAAAEFSFLMGIPVIAIAGGVKLIDLIEAGAGVSGGPLAIGFLASALSGMCAIRFLLRVIRRFTFTPFALYRIFIGVVILIVL